jgi:hypothetical protein
VLQLKRLVVKLAAVDRRQPSAVAVDKVATLNPVDGESVRGERRESVVASSHEVLDDAVERTALVSDSDVVLLELASAKLSASGASAA